MMEMRVEDAEPSSMLFAFNGCGSASLLRLTGPLPYSVYKERTSYLAAQAFECDAGMG